MSPFPDLAILDRLRAARPLIHCVSNIVAANDCANVLLAAGASPMMAQCALEAEAVTAASRATVLNTGTPDEGRFDLCRLLARCAGKLGHPVVLDPVGVGTSPWRLSQIRRLLDETPPAILRVNLGEALALLGASGREQGVDGGGGDPAARRGAALALSAKCGCAVLLSGPEDHAAWGGRVFRIEGGSALTAYVTGSGCMLSVLCGAFAAVTDTPGEAAALASVFWKSCARRAEAAAAGSGPGSFRAGLMDAAYALTPQDLARDTRIAAE